MKKNIILGFAAVTFAISSAFGTLGPEQAWVTAKNFASDINYTCQPTLVACSNAGSIPCSIEVNTILRGRVGTFGKRGSSCFSVLTSASPSPIMASDWFYDVQY